MPRTLAPKGSVMAKEPALWFTLSDGSVGPQSLVYIPLPNMNIFHPLCFDAVDTNN